MRKFHTSLSEIYIVVILFDDWSDIFRSLYHHVYKQNDSGSSVVRVVSSCNSC